MTPDVPAAAAMPPLPGSRHPARGSYTRAGTPTPAKGTSAGQVSAKSGATISNDGVTAELVDPSNRSCAALPMR